MRRGACDGASDPGMEDWWVAGLFCESEGSCIPYEGGVGATGYGTVPVG